MVLGHSLTSPSPKGWATLREGGRDDLVSFCFAYDCKTLLVMVMSVYIYSSEP